MTALVIFVGGANDSVHHSMEHIMRDYAASSAGREQIVEYYAHDAHDEIAARMRNHKGPIVLIGHSWGGDTVLDVVHRNKDLRVDLVVTLDPVGAFTNWVCVDSNVGRWVNLRVDYEAAGFSWDNLIAALGQPYGPRPRADHDAVVPGANHQDTDRLFEPIRPVVGNVDRMDLFIGGKPACGSY